MPQFSNHTYFDNTGNSKSTGFSSGTNIRYFTPQPGSLEVSASSASLEVMDVGNWEAVLNYLGINPEEQAMRTFIPNTYVQGTTVQFFTSKPFLAQDNVTIIDPDQVYFGFQINGGVPEIFNYTFGIGDPTSTIVRVGLGLYVASIDTDLYDDGVWVYSFLGEPDDAINHDQTKTKVRAMGELLVLKPTFYMG